MIRYRKPRRSYIWLLGLLAFLLAMAITFAEVHALEQFGFGAPGSTSTTPTETITGSSDIPLVLDDPKINTDDPISTGIPAVPEPASLTLLGIGIGALAMSRRKK